MGLAVGLAYVPTYRCFVGSIYLTYGSHGVECVDWTLSSPLEYMDMFGHETHHLGVSTHSPTWHDSALCRAEISTQPLGDGQGNAWLLRHTKCLTHKHLQKGHWFSTSVLVRGSHGSGWYSLFVE